eukprot:3172547-Ditylum_brightwellii.AAC.1
MRMFTYPRAIKAVPHPGQCYVAITIILSSTSQHPPPPLSPYSCQLMSCLPLLPLKQTGSLLP